MTLIIDNINHHFLLVLKQAIQAAYRADFCVSYFNLRGWKEIDQQIDA